MDKIKTINFFSTDVDYKKIEEHLHANNCILVDTKPSFNSHVSITERITTSHGSEIAILNTDIFPLNEYQKSIVNIGDYFHFSSVGKGLIQILKSDIAKYDVNCLKDGRISASYKKEDTETDQWVTSFFKWIKKESKKVYQISTTRNLTSDNPEKDYFAFPDAAKKYCSENNKYLTILKDVYCISL